MMQKKSENYFYELIVKMNDIIQFEIVVQF